MNIADLKCKKGQNVCFLNIRSLYNHFSEIETDFKDSKFVALCFCETWLNSTIINGLIELSGYKMFRLDRKYQKRWWTDYLYS